ncbi:hypothetical protein P0136_02965 [Lentisphaerota bacterium ZTH]|nr:hypothetical protein JYG24_05895 [Lentisphaerota bacterium]WET06963.1 hypothetical protein P0136_02965 [Lentisphaerota bacterium ZTH]
MKKLLFLLAFLLLPFSILAHIHEIISKNQRILVSPSIAENGKSLVYVGIDCKTGRQAIFISYLEENGTFSKPKIAVNTDCVIENIDKGFRYLQPNYVPFSAEEFRDQNGLDSPSVQDKIITFSATLIDSRRGVFYAIKRLNKWHVYPIAIQGQTMPIKDKSYYKSFNAPYISARQKAIFLATAENKLSYIFSYKIPDKLPKAEKPVMLVKATEKICEFRDISVDKANFASIAKDENGILSVYTFDRHSGSFSQTAPDGNELFKKMKNFRIKPEGVSYFANKVAFSTCSIDKDGKNVYAIYSNSGNNEFAIPVISSNEVINSICVRLAKIWNPTLYTEDNTGYITFMGVLQENSRITGVYLATLRNGKVNIDPIAVPGQRLADGRMILAATIGAVSIRHGIIPLALRLDNGDNVIAVARVN